MIWHYKFRNHVLFGLIERYFSTFFHCTIRRCLSEKFQQATPKKKATSKPTKPIDGLCMKQLPIKFSNYLFIINCVFTDMRFFDW